MRYIKWIIIAIFWLFVLAVLHYTLPQNDVVRITDTYEKRVDPGENSIFWASPDAGASTQMQNRDVFFIQTFQSNGKPMIYRNEDTGWGWPPYFKFDSSNLQAEASDLISKRSEENAQWVAVKHYGWRIEFLSVFPNAISVRPVAGPDVRIIPWTAIVILLLLVALWWGLRVRWLRFKRKRIDPLFDGE